MNASKLFGPNGWRAAHVVVLFLGCAKPSASAQSADDAAAPLAEVAESDGDATADYAELDDVPIELPKGMKPAPLGGGYCCPFTGCGCGCFVPGGWTPQPNAKFCPGSSPCDYYSGADGVDDHGCPTCVGGGSQCCMCPPDTKGSEPKQPDIVAADAMKTCPASPPSWPTACADGLHCSYGQECCCGQCSASIECDCNGGVFGCGYTDFCMGPQCSPGCKLYEYQTPKGCASCAAIGQQLPVAVSETIAPFVACTTADDCATSKSVKLCGSECSFSLAKASAEQGNAALYAAASMWCGGGYGCTVPCPQQGDPVCWQGKCRLAKPCDPSLYPVGSPCDDGNACTQGDVCSDANQCSGTPANCDDKNSCTTDTCMAASGCVHTNNSLPCTTGAPCSLGGVCKAGVCQEGGAGGWNIALPPPLPGPTGGVALLSGGSVVAVHAEQSGVAGRALSATAKGVVLWDKPKFVTGLVCDVAADTANGFVVGARIYGGLPNGKAVVSRFDANGELSWSADILLPMADNVRLRLASDGSWIASGSQNKKSDNNWQAWVSRLDAAGKVLATTDLGTVEDYGSLTYPAPQGTSIGVLTTAAGAKNLAGDQSDLRFVRLDFSGKISLDTVVLSDPTYDRPAGLVAVQGGWLGAAASTAYGKDSKSLSGWLLRFDTDGKLLWAKQTKTAIPFALVADSATSMLGELSVPTFAEYTFRSVDADGAKGAPFGASVSLLGTAGVHVAVSGDGGAIVLATPTTGAHLLRLLPAGCP